jgi:hypothetical protein
MHLAGTLTPLSSDGRWAIGGHWLEQIQRVLGSRAWHFGCYANG